MEQTFKDTENNTARTVTKKSEKETETATATKLKNALKRYEKTLAQISAAQSRTDAMEPPEDAEAYRAEREKLIAKAERDQAAIKTQLGEFIGKLDTRLGAFVHKEIAFCTFTGSDGRSLVQDPRLSSIDVARFKDANLIRSICRLTDMITMRHIKEEMDRNNYLTRVEQQFDRLLDDSSELAQAIVPIVKNNGGTGGVLALIEAEIKHLTSIMTSASLDRFPEEKERMVRIEEQLIAIMNFLKSLHDLAGTDLVAFCDETNRDYVRNVTREAAANAEKPWMFRILVMIAAAAAFVLAETGITQSRSLFLIEHRAAILSLVVVGMIALSSFLGTRLRNQRIEKLRSRMRERLADLAALKSEQQRKVVAISPMTRLRAMFSPKKKPDKITNAGRNDESHGHQGDKDQTGLIGSLFQPQIIDNFTAAPVNNHDMGVLAKFALERSVDARSDLRSKAWVFLGNVGALMAIYLFFVVAWPMGAATGRDFANLMGFNSVTQTLIGHNSAGVYCILESGEITRIDDDYVNVYTTAAGDVRIDRDRVVQIEINRDSKLDTKRDLPDCDADKGPSLPATEVVIHDWDLPVSQAPQEDQRAGLATDAALTGLADNIDKLNSTLRDAPLRIAAPITVTLVQQYLQTEFPAISIFINGAEVQVSRDRNALLLPLFSSPVMNLGEGGKTRAYDYGRRSLDGADANAANARQFLDIVFPRVLQCVKHGGRIDLDIAGYASATWARPNGHDPNLLNLYLAEGRRAAVLARLWHSIPSGDTGIATRIGIKSASGVTVPLADVMAQAEPPYRFLNEAGEPDVQVMTADLSRYVGDLDGAKLGDAIREVLSRSVLIRIDGVDGEICGISDAPADATTVERGLSDQPEAIVLGGG